MRLFAICKCSRSPRSEFRRNGNPAARNYDWRGYLAGHFTGLGGTEDANRRDSDGIVTYGTRGAGSSTRFRDSWRASICAMAISGLRAVFRLLHGDLVDVRQCSGARAPSIAFTAMSCTCCLASASCFSNAAICSVCRATIPSSVFTCRSAIRFSVSASFLRTIVCCVEASFGFALRLLGGRLRLLL